MVKTGRCIERGDIKSKMKMKKTFVSKNFEDELWASWNKDIGRGVSWVAHTRVKKRKFSMFTLLMNLIDLTWFGGNLKNILNVHTRIY